MNIADWTTGSDGIAYQTCGNCKSIWYFNHSFCPQCGTCAPAPLQASGLGTVHARTLVARAPTEQLRAYAPYLIVLVDADEGFRLMAHGDANLLIGDRVRARYTALAGQKIPYFERVQADRALVRT
jgi:uncharacterized OB-fold protein